MRRFAAALFGLTLAVVAGSANAAAPLANWAAVFVAGDARDHEGGPSEGFDNARRDLAQAFVTAGFSPEHIRQFSVHPERYSDTRPMKSELIQVTAELSRLAVKAPDGCLIYFTSHGSPQGAIVGDEMLSPTLAADLVGATCADRPTVVVISACFSGVFVSALQAPNRMVLTAARPDRSSFGCGQTDKYPYFDACMLESLPTAPDFGALGRAAQTCVAHREQAENLAPASEPQLAIGGELRPVLPLFPFVKGPVALAGCDPNRAGSEAACGRARP